MSRPLRIPLAHSIPLVGLAMACTGEIPDADVDERLLAPETALVILVLDGVCLDESLGTGISSVDGEATETYLPSFREQVLDQGAVMSQGIHLGVTITTEAPVELVTGRRPPLAPVERATDSTPLGT